MAAAGRPDGEYRLGGLQVTVADQVARITGTDTIAGSTLTLAEAVRQVVAAGWPVPAALRSATEIPADAVGLPAGRIRVGHRADLVTWRADLTVDRVFRAGRPVG